jgi:tripartite-type tricarboxylate transporter receptor subunit TctC
MHIPFNAYRITALALFTGMLSLQPLFVSAQANYPNKTVKMIVPLTPGSGADIAGRIVAKNLSESWKQPVIIENRPGAGGLVGTGVVVNSDPDGYTLLVQSASYAANPAIYKKLPYDLKSLKDVNILGTSPYALVVSAESPYKSLKDLVNAAKSKPEIIPFASAGVGSSTHLAAEYFNQTMGIKMLHVPFKGSPEAIQETIAGRTAYYMAPLQTAIAQIQGGKVRALGVTSATRAEAAPIFRRLLSRVSRTSKLVYGSVYGRHQQHRLAFSKRSIPISTVLFRILRSRLLTPKLGSLSSQ